MAVQTAGRTVASHPHLPGASSVGNASAFVERLHVGKALRCADRPRAQDVRSGTSMTHSTPCVVNAYDVRALS